VLGQDTNKPAAEKKAPAQKTRSLPFRGKITAIDKTAKTLTVGGRTFSITSETRVYVGDKAATLDDGKVDWSVTGSYKVDDGKLIAQLVTFVSKAEGKEKAK
jgi:anti-sigma28 factor (negative regulator of flagellin synthesis)